VDPMAEASDAVSTYHYSGNNPVMYNDPLGDKKLEALPPHGGGNSGGGTIDVISMMLNSAFGGSWTPDGGFSYFGSETDALYEGAEYISATGSWGGFWGMART
ncbi:RHS repeat-associated core domain-containing protein, partial [Pararcticibacter amylolyticus]